LAAGLALNIAAGWEWLDRFPCASGRVLVIDGELHPENLAHRYPAVAAALGMPDDILCAGDVWALRGAGDNLFTLGDRLQQVEPGRYALVILDAWYRFLPPGISENDNAAVMSLYNCLDGYAERLGAAWVNIHHASKGDQSSKGVTDMGSGAGSQSRAADLHLVIRPHETDGVAVIEAAVRSWPPVEALAIRWEFPIWSFDAEADPRALRKPRDRSTREDKDRRLDEDRQAIVNVLYANRNNGPQTKTFIRDAARIRTQRFGFAWESLLADGTITLSGEPAIRGNNRRFEGFVLSKQDDET
jgi:hypothetical protein